MDSFEAYMDTLEDAITEKCPKLVDKATDLVTKLEEVQRDAPGQFENLDALKKLSAAKALAANASNIPEIPDLIKSAIEDMKREVEQAREAGEDI